MRIRSVALPLLALLTSTFGCSKGSHDVTIYIAQDQEHSESIIKEFEKESGLRVNARYDTEASKTVGLVSAIIEEAGRPQADLFWNNEPAQSARLAQKGLLAPYASPSAADIPAEFKHPENLYTGFAARARVLIVNTQKIPNETDRPKSMWDLIDPKWKGNCAIARPLTGSTLTHFVTLRQVLGEAEFERFVAGLFANDVKFLQSNSATMRAVRDGEVAFAFTDTDDFNVALDKGYPVTCVFPDQGEGQIGTMLFSNTLVMVKGGPNPENAKKLADFLLSKRVEGMLAESKSAHIPVRADVPGPKVDAILPISKFKAMKWDPAKTAEAMEESAKSFAKRFGG